MAAMERPSPSRHGCARIPRADSTSASTTGRSVWVAPSALPRNDRVIRAIVFDLDNTLTDFMKMKADAVEAAIDGMVDAGLNLPRAVLRERIDAIYRDKGLEYQQVVDGLLERQLG